MNNKTGAKRLLHAMTDVDDRYVGEAVRFADQSGKKQKEGRKIIRFRRTWYTLAAAAACFVLIFTGIRLTGIRQQIGTQEENDDTGNDIAANPYEEVSSLKAAQQITGFDMQIPDAAEPYTNVLIAVISGNMIEAAYYNEDETDMAYAIRKAEGSDDISGDYNEYENTGTENVDGISVTLKGDQEGWSVATWTDGGYTYAIDAPDHPLTTQAVLAMVKEIR